MRLLLDLSHCSLFFQVKPVSTGSALLVEEVFYVRLGEVERL